MIRTARVVKVHPKSRTLDCVDMETGYPIAGVTIMSATLSKNTGLWAVPSVPRPSSHQAASGIADEGDVMLACLLPAAGGRYVCIGFASMKGATGALTERDDELIYRHPSGTVINVQPDGTTVLSVPGGVVHRLNVDGTAHITAPTSVTMDTPLVKMTGELEVAKATRLADTLDVEKQVTGKADVVASGVSLVQHIHTGNGAGRPTSAPVR